MRGGLTNLMVPSTILQDGAPDGSELRCTAVVESSWSDGFERLWRS